MELSIIIPVYNGEKTIERCINSCLVNLPKFSYEILIVDDGSTDGTERICKKYLDDSHVKYLKKENGGVSDARNFGLLKAQGQFICFLDADDEIILESVYEGVKWGIQNKLDLIQLGYIELTSKREKRCVSLERKMSTDTKSAEINMNYVWAKLFKLKYIKDREVRFDTTMPIAEDYLFVMELLPNIKSGTLNKIGYIYDNKESCASKKYVNNLVYCNEKIIEAALALKKFACEKDKCKEKQLLYIYSGVRELNNLYKNGSPYDSKSRRKEIESIIEHRFSELSFRKGIKEIKGITNIAVFIIVRIRVVWLIDQLLRLYSKLKMMRL